MSSTYYDENALTYFDATVGVEMNPLYQKFLPLIPEGAMILDAGCGSGRDAANFKRMGYSVTAFDSSSELCRLASAHLGHEVHHMLFKDISWERAYDGVWACASLLHVPILQLPSTFERLMRALKPGGVMYCSFKLGQGERIVNGRSFTDLDEPGLKAILAGSPSQTEVTTWVTDDLRPNTDEKWLNAIIASR